MSLVFSRMVCDTCYSLPTYVTKYRKCGNLRKKELGRGPSAQGKIR
jgi:hypothetical protein